MRYIETLFLDCLDVLSLDAARVLCYFLDCQPQYRTFKRACRMLNLKERTAKTVFKELQAKDFIFQWADSKKYIYKLCAYPAKIANLVSYKLSPSGQKRAKLGFNLELSNLQADNIDSLQVLRLDYTEQQRIGLTTTYYLLNCFYTAFLRPLATVISLRNICADYTDYSAYIPKFTAMEIAQKLNISEIIVKKHAAIIKKSYGFSPLTIKNTDQDLDAILSFLPEQNN